MSYNLPDYLTITHDASAEIKRVIARLNPDKTAVLVDDNTVKHCLPLVEHSFNQIIEIQHGERQKNLTTCEFVWKKLTDANFSRKSLLLNLGGGVIGDMGGFIAATYKRGIRFVNVPTTLLSQVDASIGGKLGVDFGSLKNHIGLFKDPDHVIVAPEFLQTLPERELKSGYAEVVKHSLIYDSDQWESLRNQSFENLNWEQIIPKSIEIKNDIVGKDPLENGLRKILNFGHTLGHAIESNLLTGENPLLHGEAVAVGMILESHLCMQKGSISKATFEEIKHHLENVFTLPKQLPSYEELSAYLMQDKKNDEKGISFSLLEEIGKGSYDERVVEERIRKCLEAYQLDE